MHIETCLSSALDGNKVPMAYIAIILLTTVCSFDFTFWVTFNTIWQLSFYSAYLLSTFNWTDNKDEAWEFHCRAAN